MLKNTLIAKTQGKADESQIFIGYNLRITILSSRLIRVEKSDNYTDLASFAVWYRKFECGKMNISLKDNDVLVETDDVVFCIRNQKPYSVYFKDTKTTEIFEKQENLLGTTRTLDRAFEDGADNVHLEDGFITRSGAYLFDDSKSVLIDEDGHFVTREKDSLDYYAFAYGKNYRQTIQALFMISSKVPLVPRFALGVWWSRYHAYSQQEYLDLMERFKDEDIPITVATVDMDWHWVKNIKKRFGYGDDGYNGWTGYSWNTDLFPDYKDFIKSLKAENLHVTLNLHPADGVAPYEDMYEDFAKAVNVDPKTKTCIPFRCSDDSFWNAYFDILHKPYERDGVDFWWIDWQQGETSDVDGLDPLNALNHYHYLDNAEDGRIPMILSRYAGIGSHRYPLGFSGDTYIDWRSLDFQPYFTITANNVGYSWWSHDIGGHMLGTRDDDLYMRWLEFGVFSPIMRLHSTNLNFLGKEPWKYRSDVYKAAKYWLNLRHKMIPYIYTMDKRTHTDGIALCEPMYYSYPQSEEAYNVPNQYMFGSELMVCPITTPQHKDINMGSVDVWLPEGKWTDIFTLKTYEGNRRITMFRDLDAIPVLAKQGAIIPLSADEGNKTDNPESLEIWAFSGNGKFELVEDGNRCDYENHTVKTLFEINYENNKLTFTINKSQGDLSVIPQKRNYKVIIKDLVENGRPLTFEINHADVNKTYKITEEFAEKRRDESACEAFIRLVSRWQATAIEKFKAYEQFDDFVEKERILEIMDRSKLPSNVIMAIKEML